MLFRAKVLLLMIFVSLPAIALAQKSAPTTSKPAKEQTDDTVNFAQPDVAMAHFNLKAGDEVFLSVPPVWDALLKHVQPEAIAAEIIKCPVDKIVMVPHIFWHEPKWLDWAQSVNQTRHAHPTFGPEGKIYLSAEMVVVGGYAVKIEMGPYLVQDNQENRAINLICRRIAAKMVRDAPEFSREFARQQQRTEFDQIAARIRDLDNEAEPLRKQLQAEVGLSQVQLSERVADLQRQLLTADLSVQVMKAREKAIREQLADVKAETKTSTSDAINTLKRIVELRKARFERLKTVKSTAAVSQEDVDKAEEEMLAAQVDLDRAAAMLQKSDSQSQLDPLTAELRKIVVDRAEAEARMVFLANANEQSMAALAHRREADTRDDRLQAQLKEIEFHRSTLRMQLNQAKDALNTPTQSLQISLRE